MIIYIITAIDGARFAVKLCTSRKQRPTISGNAHTPKKSQLVGKRTIGRETQRERGREKEKKIFSQALCNVINQNVNISL